MVDCYVATYINFKPEPNMLKTLLIIASSTSQKIPIILMYFILISLPIIPILFFSFYCYVY